MSSDASAEQVEIRRKGRQRLIGAVTIALLAAVFIPMLLDPEPRERVAEPVLSIPPKESAPPLPAAAGPAPEGDAATSAAAPPVERSAPEELPTGKPSAGAPAVAPEQRPTVEPKAAEFKASAPRPAPPVAAEPKPAEGGAPRLEGYAVQVGAFKDEAKLAQAREKLAAARLSHYTERLKTPSGELTRLRAGPFPNRADADKAAAEVKRAGLDGRVVSLP